MAKPGESVDDNLTPKQRLFVEEYLIDLNATQAALRAGYSEHSAKQIGTENLAKPSVQSAIAREMEARSKRTLVSADYVITTIKDTVERCRQAQPVTRKGVPVMIETEDGEMAPAYVFDAQGVLKGCELLGKHLKLFADRVEHSGPNGKPIETRNLADVPDEQLDARIAEALAKARKEPEE